MFIKLNNRWYLMCQNGNNIILEDVDGKIISKNIEDFNIKEQFDSDNWYLLCKNKHYYPTITDENNIDVWLSPDGYYFNGKAHACEAEYLCEYLYDKKMSINMAEDYLLRMGWVKLTTSLMSQFYENEGMYDNLTDRQKDSFKKWKDAHNI